MPLIDCPECGKKVSDHAISCIGCGYPLQDKRAAAPLERDSNAKAETGPTPSPPPLTQESTPSGEKESYYQRAWAITLFLLGLNMLLAYLNGEEKAVVVLAIAGISFGFSLKVWVAYKRGIPFFSFKSFMPYRKTAGWWIVFILWLLLTLTFALSAFSQLISPPGEEADSAEKREAGSPSVAESISETESAPSAEGIVENEEAPDALIVGEWRVHAQNSGKDGFFNREGVPSFVEFRPSGEASYRVILEFDDDNRADVSVGGTWSFREDELVMVFDSVESVKGTGLFTDAEEAIAKNDSFWLGKEQILKITSATNTRLTIEEPEKGETYLFTKQKPVADSLSDQLIANKLDGQWTSQASVKRGDTQLEMSGEEYLFKNTGNYVTRTIFKTKDDRISFSVSEKGHWWVRDGKLFTFPIEQTTGEIKGIDPSALEAAAAAAIGKEDYLKIESASDSQFSLESPDDNLTVAYTRLGTVPKYASTDERLASKLIGEWSYTVSDDDSKAVRSSGSSSYYSNGKFSWTMSVNLKNDAKWKGLFNGTWSVKDRKLHLEVVNIDSIEGKRIDPPEYANQLLQSLRTGLIGKQQELPILSSDDSKIVIDEPNDNSHYTFTRARGPDSEAPERYQYRDKIDSRLLLGKWIVYSTDSRFQSMGRSYAGTATFDSSDQYSLLLRFQEGEEKKLSLRFGGKFNLYGHELHLNPSEKGVYFTKGMGTESSDYQDYRNNPLSRGNENETTYAIQAYSDERVVLKGLGQGLNLTLIRTEMAAKIAQSDEGLTEKLVGDWKLYITEDISKGLERFVGGASFAKTDFSNSEKSRPFIWSIIEKEWYVMGNWHARAGGYDGYDGKLYFRPERFEMRNGKERSEAKLEEDLGMKLWVEQPLWIKTLPDGRIFLELHSDMGWILDKAKPGSTLKLGE